MTSREDERVVVDPGRVSRVVTQDTELQNVPEWGERHRRSLVAALGRQGRIHGQATDHGDGEGVEFGGERGFGGGHVPTVPVGRSHSSDRSGDRGEQREGHDR